MPSLPSFVDSSQIIGYTYKANTESYSNHTGRYLMKNPLLIFVLTMACLNFAPAGHAQNAKFITLTDGSVIKGRVIELKDNTYTIEILPDWKGDPGEQVEPLKVPASSVESITSVKPDTEPVPAQSTDLKEHVSKMQEKIMADTEIMGQMNQIAEQEEVQKLLSDPKLLDDVMSMDPDKIQNSAAVQQLLNNPEMQKLLLQIQQKFPAQ